MPFPLTPTLSLGEREFGGSALEPSEALESTHTFRCPPKRPAFFPLPGGEGQGEGEGIVRSFLRLKKSFPHV
jgi:hypothetical protein